MHRGASDPSEHLTGLGLAIADIVTEGLLVADVDGAITYVNPPGLAMLGYTAQELVGCPFHATLDPGGGGDAFRGKDGTLVPVESASSRIAGVGGGEVVTFRDISARLAASAARTAAEAEARRSGELHRILTANLPETTVFLLDRELRILVADGEGIRRLPWFDESLFVGRRLAELDGMVPPDVLERSIATYEQALEGERGDFEFLSEGLTFAIQAVPVRADDGTVEAVLVVARDTSERTRAEARIANQARQQQAVAELGRFALESQDLKALMAEAISAATATLAADGGGVLELSDDGQTLTVVAGIGLPDGVAGSHEVPAGADTGESPEPGHSTQETRFDASPFLVSVSSVSSVSVPIRGHGRLFGMLDVWACDPREFSEDEVAFLSAIATLITVAVERHAEERTTRHAALHDPLTDLPNRSLAIDRLEHALRRRLRDGIDVAVLVLDLDRFKIINDTAGHAAGDEVLIALASRLSQAVRATDTVARLSGDEFIVICPDVEGARGAADVAERLAAAVSARLVLGSGDHSFTASTGIALARDHRDTSESLLADADAAMYRAKSLGRGRYELFDEEMRTEALKRMRIEAELRAALTRGELKAWYQPVIDFATGRPVSSEALVRWHHPERGVIAPAEFIAIAEEAGLIAELGLQVLEQACRQTAVWQRDIDPALGVSVNVSARQVINAAFPAQVAAIAAHSGLLPGTLALEITESTLMEDADSPEAVLSSFQEHGLTLALDDFGTGYSSLSRLKLLPLDVLKIDRSFVAGVTRNADDHAIVKATIDMAHAVGLTVIAEGVETREQETSLRDLGCDRGQGYLYARPQPGPAMTDLLTSAPSRATP